MKTLFSSSQQTGNQTSSYTVLHRGSLPAFIRSGDLASIEYALLANTTDCEITVTIYPEDSISGSTQFNSGVGAGLIILKMTYFNGDNTLKSYWQFIDSNGTSQSIPGSGSSNAKHILEIAAISNIGQNTNDIVLLNAHGIFLSEV